ncbi:MAG TPA: cyclic nucleotide-binding domain-containing protein [Egibacteraceae bacterium]|nr:cyclic nucleotide-binding domain-containing protein [Actinomycetota bacterium]HWB71752.1 cyclic nucleotide-binding domain-containing protein [Egibacteraceae bacterium]
MRIESSVTSVSWIPSEAIPGPTRLPFELGVGHYDLPPPDVIDDLEALRAADRFRFANDLRAWIEVADGQVSSYGHAGRGRIGSTTVRLAGKAVTFAAVPFPDLRPAPEVGDGWVRFVQTVGGRTGVAMPRRVSRPPFVQWAAPTVWTTLALVLHADGTSQHELVGASPFPRHWVYDRDGTLAHKSGLTDFRAWSRECFGDHSPWGQHDSPAVVTEAETALERELSAQIMRGARPKTRKLKAGDTLMEQGERGNELYLVLDGVLAVEVDGEAVAEVGPGAIVGERAVLEAGQRTATLRAVTPCRAAVAAAEQLDRESLARLAQGHRREQ